MNIIGAFDRGTVSILEPRPNSVLIMMTSPNSEFPKINGKWTDILKLKFDDVEDGFGLDDKQYEPMNEYNAEQILDFVIRNIDKDIFVSCDAGLSRSPAVVVALEQIFNSRDVSNEREYQHYNRYVKNTIRDVWFKRIWKKSRSIPAVFGK
jgi:predicted protein tyrosine phosphatase